MLNYFELSRSGYHDWITRGAEYLNRYEINRIDLANVIVDIHQRYPSKGYRLINDVILSEMGWVVSDYLVHQVCRELNVKSKAGKYNSRRRVNGEEHKKFPRLVRNWKTSRPFEKIASDSTMIKFNGKRYDLTFYIDAFNNEIVSYDINKYRHGNDFGNHIRALKGFLFEKEKRGYKDLATFLHTDQGIIYTSRAFEEAHKDYNIIRSMSRAAVPQDNGKIESINRWIKTELYLDWNHEAYENVYHLMDEYMFYYNNYRKTRKLNKKSPIEYLDSFEPQKFLNCVR